MSILIDLYRKMCLIRKAEEKIIEEYPRDQMKTPMHMSMGGEAIVAGVVYALDNKTHYFGTYRSHALYLAVTEETRNFFGEMYGKADGIAGGKAGSMHLASPEHGLMAASAVVGTTIPLALGDAFEAKYNGSNRIAAVFFGDGATDEGVFWETLNAACLWQLPILFICEDNGLAIHVSKYQRRGYDDLAEILSKFKCSVVKSDGDDVQKVYDLAIRQINSIRIHQQPAVMILNYYRYLEHVGVNEDFDAAYRSRNEFLAWRAKDPVLALRQHLIDIGLEPQIQQLEYAVETQIKTDIQAAKDAPFPSGEELRKGVFYGE